MRKVLAVIASLTYCVPALDVAASDQGKLLREAAIAGDRGGVERALAAGANVDDASESGGTALMFAAYGDHRELVTWLLEEAGADPDLGDRHDDPAINWAAYAGAASAVEALLAGGADPEIVTHHGDALAIAMRRGFPRIVERLADHTGIATGDTALHEAARAGDLDEVDRLLSSGLPVDVENRIGYTPLMEGAREGHAAVVRKLIEVGADPMHRGNDLGMGMTALHLAADRNQPEIARILLNAGTPVDIGNVTGGTPLLWALGEGATETAFVLLDAGADPTLEDDLGYSALGMAEYLDNSELRARLVGAVE